MTGNTCIGRPGQPFEVPTPEAESSKINGLDAAKPPKRSRRTIAAFRGNCCRSATLCGKNGLRTANMAKLPHFRRGETTWSVAVNGSSGVKRNLVPRSRSYMETLVQELGIYRISLGGMAAMVARSPAARCRLHGEHAASALSSSARPRRERSRVRTRRLLLAAATAMAMIAWPGGARAQMLMAPSAGCAAANAGIYDSASSGGTPVTNPFTGTFTAGETLTFTTLGFVVSSQATDNTAGVTILSPGPGNRTQPYTIPADGARSFTTVIQGDVEGGTATMTVRCTPATSASMPPMETVTTMDMMDAMEMFVQVRIDRLLLDEPDRPRLLRKNPAALIGSAAFAPFALNSQGGSTTFNTSLRQWASHMARQETKKAASVAGQAGRPVYGVAPTVPRPGGGKLDVWTEAHFTALKDDNDDVKRSANALIAYLGADYLLRPDVLVGALIQYDNMDEDADRLKGHADGEGFMAGPYVSMRVSPHLYFDARAAWGRSDNDQLVDNARGSYHTDRWLVKGELTGDLHWRRLRIQPRVAAKYFQEDRGTFTDSHGNLIGGRDSNVGRLMFGSEISRHFVSERGLIVEPFVKLDGIWDFEKTDPIMGHIRSYLDDDTRGKIGGGVMVSRADNYNIRAWGSYDGLFSDDFEAVSGRLWLNIPLN